MTTTATPKALPPYDVTAGAVLALQSMTSYPSVSVLMSTQPGVWGREERARLAGLRASVAARLESDDVGGVGRLLAELDRLAEMVEDVVVDRALALYVNDSHSQLLVLPVEVRERAVVDPTFATRDLVRALHRTPRHVVLVLSAHEARLFEGQGADLQPAEGSKFPLVAEGPEGQDREARRFLTRVDQALGAYLRLRPAPVVVIGAEPNLSRFCNLSGNLGRLAGRIAGNHVSTPLGQIAGLVAPHLERYLASRQDEALELLDQRRGQDRAVLGLPSVWLAARWERPEMLAVEIDFFFPARLSPDGDSLMEADDVEHPDVIDDVVDELVEQVLARGAWVSLVEPGRIPDGQRIALTTRTR